MADEQKHPVPRWTVHVTHYRGDGGMSSSIETIFEHEVGDMVLSIPMWSRVRTAAGALQRQIENSERKR